VTPPSLARRTTHIAPFQVMELVKRATRLQAAGHPVIHMSIGEPDFRRRNPWCARWRWPRAGGRRAAPPPWESRRCGEAIAHHYAEFHGASVDPGRVIVTAGASAALTLACCALVDPGAEVLMTEPGLPVQPALRRGIRRHCQRGPR
jgi:aspartate/methionine/tyrosine aminotransferase